ncbi:hypothetical protein LTR37_010888 [Vermiconidia calcicola]|uniref:Uncharacterized protein n=1 Tax=Vermiconidia calcicola TaxID=1690605 RepID=A0ACC3N3V0_9PEZI|nr:hypothetical protein LTR37_010888 [Vermiconidia calcicola]
MSPKPTILIIPGAFGLPEWYDSIVKPVAAHGYSVQAIKLPSVAYTKELVPGEGPAPTMYDDAAFIAAEVSKLAGEGQDIMLLAHSYGGVPTTQSTKGLSKDERQQEGKQGGIVRLTYLTSLVPALGQSASSVLAGAPPEQTLDFNIDESGWMTHSDLPNSARICFSDLPQAEGEAWMQKFTRHSALSFPSELTHAGYKDIPVSYLICTEDLCIPVEVQREEVAMMERESGRKVDVTEIKADHIPIAGKPEMVVAWILDVLSKM